MIVRKTTRRNKYNAIKTVVNGKTCDSKLEAKHYNILLTSEREGKIKDIVFHPRFPIRVNGKKIGTVVLDFQFYDNQQEVYRFVDSKGVYTSNSRFRHKLLSAIEGIEIEIWKK